MGVEQRGVLLRGKGVEHVRVAQTEYHFFFNSNFNYPLPAVFIAQLNSSDSCFVRTSGCSHCHAVVQNIVCTFAHGYIFPEFYYLIRIHNHSWYFPRETRNV